jgi:hypothetical protein
MEKVVRYAQVEFSDVLCALKIVHVFVIIFRLVLFKDICVWIVLLSDHSVEILHWFVVHHGLILSVNDLSMRVQIHNFVFALLNLLLGENPSITNVVLFDSSSGLFKIFNSFIAWYFLGY